MARRKTDKVASAMHAVLLLRLQQLFAQIGKKAGRGKAVPIREGMKLAGASEQLYNQWQHGASPRLVTLERMSAQLGVPLHELLGIEVATVTSSQKLSGDSLEVGQVLDQITDTELRAAVARRLIALIPTLLGDETAKLLAAVKPSKSAR